MPPGTYCMISVANAVGMPWADVIDLVYKGKDLIQSLGEASTGSPSAIYSAFDNLISTIDLAFYTNLINIATD